MFYFLTGKLSKATKTTFVSAGNFLSTVSPHYTKEYSYETFPKPKWHKTKKQLPLIYVKKTLCMPRSPQMTY